MSTYKCLQVKSRQKESVRDHDGNIKKIKYAETVVNHFDYCGAVDDNNNKTHDGGTKHGLSIEETWRTTHWCIRVFSFILAITEVIAFLMIKFFGNWKGTQLEFFLKNSL